MPNLTKGTAVPSLYSHIAHSNDKEETDTKTSQPLVPVNMLLSVIRKHIPRQSDIDKIVKSIKSRVIHGLELPIQEQDLVKSYQTSMYFRDIYHYVTDRKLPPGTKAQNCICAEALNYVTITGMLKV